MNENIKNLVFDLGGVIMDLKRERCVEALEALGMKDAESMLGLYKQTGPFLELEEGKLSPAEFRDAMREKIDGDVTDGQLDNALNKFLVGIPLERLRALKKLRGKYKVFMLSNTNPIMFDSKIKECFRADGLEVDDYFDGLCLSYKAKCSKPDSRIYLNMVDKFGINPEETLFFDDSQKNLDAAEKIGFKTYLVEPGTEFTEAFKNGL
jgi:HAD hydrolase, family IA, variant 3